MSEFKPQKSDSTRVNYLLLSNLMTVIHYSDKLMIGYPMKHERTLLFYLLRHTLYTHRTQHRLNLVSNSNSVNLIVREVSIIA